MCTISWFYSGESYHVFFNRDEQKNRVKAALPQVISENQGQTIMPIDPQGDGSWLSVNENGFTFALLNYYQGRRPRGRLISRGQIIRNIATFNSLEDVQGFIHSMDVESYAPFSLLCFSLKGKENADAVDLFRWTGEQILENKQNSPLISSSVKFDDVQKTRLARYNETLLKNKIVGHDENERIKAHINLHRSHHPKPSSMSICMHREDAQTQSFSHITAHKERIIFDYYEGSPCEAELPKTISISRL